MTTTARYRNLYAKLLHLYPKPYRERFGEEMEQTFNDLCRERRKAGDGLFGFVLWVFAETSAGIIRENITVCSYAKHYKKIDCVGCRRSAHTTHTLSGDAVYQ